MKEQLREEILQQRAKLQLFEKQKLDFHLNEALTDLFGSYNFETVLGYHPLKDEANILPFLDGAPQIFLPRLRNDAIEIVPVPDLEQVESGKFGVMEPKSVLAQTERTVFDLILVPGVVFSEDCHRIGYGKGYYDRLLKQITGLKVGVGYDFQVVKKILHEKHDVQLDMVVTEKGVYKI